MHVIAAILTAQFPRFDPTKKVRVFVADIAVGLKLGHSENDEPCNGRKRRIMSLKALENQD